MNKRGQEEIVGFVLIMVIVVVVLVIFLGISLRDTGEMSAESIDVYQFLESSSEVTTNCQVRSDEFSDMGSLFERCFSEEKCINELDSCEVLERQMNEILEISWNVGQNNSLKGYSFESYYENEQTREILSIQEGNCEGIFSGASYLIPAFPGKIKNNLKLCY